MLLVSIKPLATVSQLLPQVCSWFESEWPDHYGPEGAGDAHSDLVSYANTNHLPFGLVAFLGDQPCGFAAIEAERFPTHPHLFPWAGAAFVRSELRGRGIGQQMLGCLEHHARILGYTRFYCATAMSDNLLTRAGWQRIDTVTHHNQVVSIYERAL